MTYDLDFYLDPLLRYPLEIWRQTFGYQWLGWLSVYKTMWLVPVVALIWLRRSQESAKRNSILLLLGCAYVQLFFGWDTTRYLSMAFPVMLIAWETLVPHNRFDVKHWVVPCLIASLAVPNLYTAHDIIEVMHGAIQALLT
jgi:hypothetical protein